MTTPSTKIQTFCLNCGTPLTDGYCHHCGQSAETRRLTFRTMVDNVLSGLTNMDRGGLYTLLQLFIRPGGVVRDYIEGKRVEYAKPFGLLAILCGLYGILSLALYSHLHMPETFLSLEQTLDDLQLTDPVLRTIFGNVLFVNLIFSPLYALLIKWVFSGKRFVRYNFTEMLYLTVFWLCQSTVLGLLFLPFSSLLTSINTVLIGSIGINAVLLAWFFTGCFRVGWLHALAKSLLVTLLSFLAITLVMVASLLLFYHGQ